VTLTSHKLGLDNFIKFLNNSFSFCLCLPAVRPAFTADLANATNRNIEGYLEVMPLISTENREGKLSAK